MIEEGYIVINDIHLMIDFYIENIFSLIPRIMNNMKLLGYRKY